MCTNECSELNYQVYMYSMITIWTDTNLLEDAYIVQCVSKYYGVLMFTKSRIPTLYI